MPFEHFLNHYRHSHFLTLDLWAYFVEESGNAADYLHTLYHGRGIPIHWGTWIRTSTGKLCLDLIPSKTPLYPGLNAGIPLTSRPAGMSFSEPNREATFISSVTLAEYDQHCYWALARYHSILITAAASVLLGAVLDFSASSRLQCPVEIASLPSSPELSHRAWRWIDERTSFVKNSANPVAECGRGGLTVSAEVIANGWTRCDTRDDFCFYPSMAVWTVGDDMLPWLSQANHIISRSAQEHCEEYAIVKQILFQISMTEPSAALPPGYLFLCPASDFQVGPNLFRWPDCPAYWSLDSSGTNRLSADDARSAGFPSFGLLTGVQVVSWDESVYEGTRQFHEAKGYDPYSQDVARHLGRPLYHLSPEMHAEERFADGEPHSV
ncbi:hypothetical protein B0H16DRAFT_350778 [Mycena metata]|uniref:Uncharacterized protein n=1 Tax=Mycena metata TaxID=1033252 RepID=A0AAD7JL06_9AGAR|nr:hypothetical protein B0H16DRAFT_350778 [Mycena metata]